MTEEADKKDSCPHIHWMILGTDLVGYGSCFDCGKSVFLYELFNALHARMEVALKWMEDYRAQATTPQAESVK